MDQDRVATTNNVAALQVCGSNANAAYGEVQRWIVYIIGLLVAVRLRSRENPGTNKLADDIESADNRFLSIPWQKPPSKRFRQILLPHGSSRNEIRPERPERRLRLVSAMGRGRRWLDEIISGAITNAEQIALRERCSVRHVNMTISLAFLAPNLVRAAVEGRLPRGINIERLRDTPAEWSLQF
jgi:site-specific DNA recombinase